MPVVPGWVFYLEAQNTLEEAEQFLLTRECVWHMFSLPKGGRIGADGLAASSVSCVDSWACVQHHVSGSQVFGNPAGQPQQPQQGFQPRPSARERVTL